MATLSELAGTLSHNFNIGGASGIMISYGKSLPLNSYGNVGDLYIRTTNQLTPDEFYDTYAEMDSVLPEIRELLAESGKDFFYIRIKADENFDGTPDTLYKLTATTIEYIDKFGEPLGKLYYKTFNGEHEEWKSLGVYHFDEPIIKSVESITHQGDFEVSLKQADNRTTAITTGTTKDTDYEVNHNNFGVTRFATDAEAVASPISDFTQIPNNFDTVGTTKFADKYIAMTPQQVASDIKVEMVRAITVEGFLQNLTTDEKTNLVSAINELDSYIGSVTTPMVAGSTLAGKTIATGANTDVTVASAISLLNTDVKTNTDHIGTMTSLTTDEKNTLVGAINEVDSHADTNTANIGTMSNLTTSEKTTLVGAIDELDSDIGDRTSLTTDAKTNLVSAINEVDSHADTNTANIGTMSSLTTDAKDTLVNAINEVDAHTDTNTADIAQEITDRTNGDIRLQQQIDAITSKSDVADIVNNYSDLVVYNTAPLYDNDVIKVLEDETDGNATTYYRLSPVPTTPDYTVATKADLPAVTESDRNKVAKVTADEDHDDETTYYECRNVNGTYEWVYASPSKIVQTPTPHPEIDTEHLWDWIGQEGSYYTKGVADARFVHLETDETIDGTKTFTTTPIVGTVAESDSSTTAASTAFVSRAIATEDAKVVHLTGDESIGGAKTFTTTPIVGTLGASDNSTQAASTAYVTSAIATEDATVVHNTGAETVGGIKTFSNGITLSSGSTLDGTSGTVTVPTKAVGTNTTDAASTAFVKTAIDNEDALVVHLTGDETINGIKSFKNNIVLKDINVTSGQESFKDVVGVDTNNVRVGGLRFLHTSDNKKESLLYVLKGNNTLGSMGLTLDADGVTVTSRAPEPAASNSTSNTYIATTGWVNDPAKSTNVVHRTGDETITGTKTMTDATVHVKTQTQGDNSTKVASTAYVDTGLATKQPTITYTTSDAEKVFAVNQTGTGLVWKQVRDLTKLADMDDTVITSPTSGQSLIYDETLNNNQGGWKNDNLTVATIKYW